MSLFAQRRLLIFSTSAALVLSLIGKVAADLLLTERITIIGSFVGLVRAFNPGIAFGVSFPPAIQGLLIAGALLLVLWAALKEQGTPLVQAGFGLILGGALGNLLDRLHDGVVTDMFQVGTFPIFNVADSCITIGAVMLIGSGLWRHMR